MFRSFDFFNRWWNDHVPAELSLTLTRAASRVAALYQSLSNVVQEYTSAYNSVQTLGYDQSGTIEDQTSPDRLTVPDNVIYKVINRLQSQYRALVNDRDSFISNFNPEDVIGLDWKSIRNSSISEKDIVIPLNGYGSLIFHKDYRAKLQLAPGVLDLLGRTSLTNYTIDKYYTAPQFLYVETASSAKINILVFSSGAHFPQSLATVDNLNWRMIAIGDLQSFANCFVILDFKLDGVALSYKFRMTRNDWGYTSDANLPVTSLRFNSNAEFYQFLANEFSISENQISSRIIDSRDVTSLTLKSWDQYTAQQRTMFNRYFSDILSNINEQAVFTASSSQIARILFDETTSLTPEDVQDAIVALRSGMQ